MNVYFERCKAADAFAERIMKIAEDETTDIKTANQLFGAAKEFAAETLRLEKDAHAAMQALRVAEAYIEKVGGFGEGGTHDHEVALDAVRQALACKS